MNVDEKTPEAAPHYFLESTDKLATRFAVSLENGHTKSSADALQLAHGPNELIGTSGVSLWSIMSLQLFNGMILVLFMAVIVSYAIQSWIEGSVVAAVIILNIFLGTKE